jgi:hypothetical protein
MRGLIGDRFLKRFFEDILHRHEFAPTGETESEAEDGEEMSSRSDRPANKVPGKEELENIEKTDEITEVVHPEGGLDRSPGVTQPPDGDCQKTE